MPIIELLSKSYSKTDGEDIKVKGKQYLLFFVLLNLFGCASMQANKDLNEDPGNIARGDPNNSKRVKEYLLGILASPEEYRVKAYSRRAYSVNTEKNLFVFHSFYVFFKNDIMEHTLVFTATPKNSGQKGAWMLDANTDVESYNAYMVSNNPWEVVEYQSPKGGTSLDLVLTIEKILNRMDDNYIFFGGAIVRDLPWYHQVWMFLVPPPILAYTPLLLLSIHADNCSTAVLDTMVWQE
ncbi:MAG: hypothetical protein LBP42_01635 [Treponema sp.]|jgi:hypothetical protein|nr:hypothetical protein [Treponema sp.]